MVGQVTTPSRLGLKSGGANLDLFLKVYAGEVLGAFTDKAVMMPRHRVKSLTSGKSAQFPAIGTATAAYHVVGQNILDADNSMLNSIVHNERLINIDEILTSNVFVADIDEMMNHYPTRSEYAKQQGIALANKSDTQLQQVLCLAAAAAQALPQAAGQTVAGGATLHTDPALLVDAIFQAQSLLDLSNVPSEERYCLVTPDMYWRLVRMGGIYGGGANGAPVELLDNDMSSNNGDVAGGKIVRVGGVTLVPSNIWNGLANTSTVGDNEAGERGFAGADYDVDMSDIRAVVWQKQAIGTVKMRDLSLEADYRIEYQGTLVVAKHLMGHGVLRPDCVVTLKST